MLYIGDLAPRTLQQPPRATTIASHNTNNYTTIPLLPITTMLQLSTTATSALPTTKTPESPT